MHFASHINNIYPAYLQSSSSSRMRVMNHNWSATKQHLRPQPTFSFVRGWDSTKWDIVWVYIHYRLMTVSLL